MKNLTQVVEIDSEKCVNCYRCISVCPVKYCNKASDGHVEILSNLCIGCGQCIKHCEHEARIIIDDFEKAMADLKSGVKMVAIVAPSIAANIEEYLRFNGWLKSIGIKAVFDVSFGAELTVKSYLEHIQANKPELVIAQPCPAIVTYIELYKPHLLPYLAPADSPMMHTMKMVREFYPQYSDCRFFVVSPCVAKKREFDEVGMGEYNVTITKLTRYLKNKNIDLRSFPEMEYDNDPAERAVLFSTPGGLMRTAMRENPDIAKITRKIEGPEEVYNYLNSLETSLKEGVAPKLLDCLNCFMGCNGGPGTPQDKTIDEIEHRVERRNQKAMNRYKSSVTGTSGSSLKKIRKTVEKYWKKALYSRSYVNREQNLQEEILIPSSQQLEEIFASMLKTCQSDIKNCSSCGYNSCESMATAIFNGLNLKENCHLFLTKLFANEKDEKDVNYKKLKSKTESILDMVANIADYIGKLGDQVNKQYTVIDGLKESLSIMDDSIQDVGNITKEKAEDVEDLIDMASSGAEKLVATNEMLKNISKSASNIMRLLSLIEDVNEKTNVLAINAAIESARAGQSGKRFSIIAHEIRKLATDTRTNMDKISSSLNSTVSNVETSVHSGMENFSTLKEIIGNVVTIKDSYMGILKDVNSLINNNQIVKVNVSELVDIAKTVNDTAAMIHNIADGVKNILAQFIH